MSVCYYGDCRETLKTLPGQSVQCCITSPPYFGLRDYGHADQIGLEPSPESLGRQWIGCELNEQYRPLIEQRTAQMGLVLKGGTA